jgi:hypothetical protein
MNKYLKSALIIISISFAASLCVFLATNEGDVSFRALFEQLLGDSRQPPERYIAPTSATAVNITTRGDPYALDMDDGMLACVETYFTLYYGALGSLNQADAETFGKIYTYDSLSEAYDSALLSRRMSLCAGVNGLTFAACELKLEYTAAAFAAFADEIAEIELTEYCSVTYDGLAEVTDTVSSSAGVTHSFVLTKGSDGHWYVKSHGTNSNVDACAKANFEAYLSARGLVRSEMGKESLDSAVADWQGTQDTQLKYRDPGVDARADIPARYAYDRQAAADYALLWTSANSVIRNVNVYGSMPSSGESQAFAVFVSQCLAAGGLPMDTHGEASSQWKWYDNFPDFSAAQRGYSRSWLNADAFDIYIGENTGAGMVTVPCDIGDAEIGDILRCKSGDVIQYEAMVTGIENGYILVTGNGDDLRNMPVGALGFSEAEFIKVVGYDGA